jgi:membrane protease YdiL (CAAX protease family)
MTVTTETPAPLQASGLPYLDCVQQGKNEWWRYVLALFVIAFMWFIVGTLPYIAVGIGVLVDNNPATDIDPALSQVIGVNPTLLFVALMLSFVCFVAGIYIAVRFVHQRPFVGLITCGAAVRWSRLGQAVGLWLLLSAAIAVVEALLYPGRYQLTFDPLQFVVFLFFAVLLIPIQSSSEELFFRGYVLQSASLQVRNPIVLSLISGAAFMLPHLANPEVQVNIFLLPIFYFAFGAFLAYASIKDNGLELALGIHAANNLFTALFANYQGSALRTPSIFTALELDAVYNMIAVFIAMAIVYVWFFVLERKTA